MTSTITIQNRLKTLGFDPGPLDGIPGAQTRRGVRAFQSANALDPDGIVGPLTLAKLFPKEPGALAIVQKSPLPWLEAATSLLGLQEKPGARDNPKILDWAADLDIAYGADSIPWCGLFVAHCIGSTLPDEPLPNNPLGARNWLAFGRECKTQLGAVLVFWRGSKAGWKGHVAIYDGERPDAYRVIGGNQSDSVSRAWIAKNRLLGARWPATVPYLATGKLIAAGGGAVSVDEA